MLGTGGAHKRRPRCRRRNPNPRPRPTRPRRQFPLRCRSAPAERASGMSAGFSPGRPPDRRTRGRWIHTPHGRHREGRLLVLEGAPARAAYAGRLAPAPCWWVYPGVGMRGRASQSGLLLSLKNLLLLADGVPGNAPRPPLRGPPFSSHGLIIFFRDLPPRFGFEAGPFPGPCGRARYRAWRGGRHGRGPISLSLAIQRCQPIRRRVASGRRRVDDPARPECLPRPRDGPLPDASVSSWLIRLAASLPVSPFPARSVLGTRGDGGLQTQVERPAGAL